MWFLIKVELLKLCSVSKRYILAIFLISSLIICFSVSCFQFRYLNESNQYEQGPQAVQKLNEISKKGKLETDFIKEVIVRYQQIFMNSNSYDEAGNQKLEALRDWQSDQEIGKLLQKVYGERQMLIMDVNTVDKQDITTFRNRYLIDKLVEQNFSKESAQEYIQSKRLPDLNVYEPAFSWKLGIAQLPILFIGMIMYLCYVSTSVFSQERHYHMDVFLLSSKNGRIKDNIAKMMSTWIFITILYIVVITLYSSIIFGLWGITGGTTLIQMDREFLTSLFPISFINAYSYGIFLGYLACISMSAISFLISSFFRKNEVGILFSLGIFILPFTPLINILPEQLVILFPGSLVDIGKLLASSNIYHIFQTYIPKLWMSGLAMVCVGSIACIASFVVERLRVKYSKG